MENTENIEKIEVLDLSAIEEMEEVISAGQGGSLLLCCWKWLQKSILMLFSHQN